MPQTHSEARAALDRGAPEEALKVAHHSLEDDWSADAARTAGIAAFRMKDFETAEGYFVEVTKAEPQDAIATYYRGLCRERLGRPREALKHYRHAQELDPDLEEAAEKVDKLSGDEDEISEKRMTEFGLPGTEEDVSEYQRRLEEKKKAEIRAQWRGQPAGTKAITIAILVVFFAGACWMVYNMIAFEMP